ncbi:hypothetical protein VTK73DRAFT_4448 [Phialemonium thermophilum]|uniref:C2H2-type domain-containing protein n=1 Tax=Phialemonium thermophilum TaxID=223376 RepID=A0ABR3V8L8_9PEZI
MLSPPDTTDSHLPSGALSCPQCDRSFSRPSHLNRHRLTHLPRMCSCATCASPTTSTWPPRTPTRSPATAASARS